MSDKVVIFGAGAIGRGLLAELVANNGLKPVFVEAVPEFAAKLHHIGKYTIRLVGKKPKDVRIDHYDILTLDQTEKISDALSECSFAATAVGGANLKQTANTMTEGIKARTSPLNILICENYPKSDRIISEALHDKNIGKKSFSAICCSVERMVRKVADSFDLLGESCQTLFADATKCCGQQPDVKGLFFTDNFDAFYARKLYTNNAGHAMLAYKGHLVGCQYIHQALKIPSIYASLTELLSLAGRALVQQFNIDPMAMQLHIQDLIEWRFSNIELSDPIDRVARDPFRKLGPNERLVGLANLLKQYNLATGPVAETIAAALHYHNSNDSESQKMGDLIEKYGPEYILEKECKFNKNDAFYKNSLKLYKEILLKRN